VPRHRSRAPSSLRRRRVLATLAAGLVLGVGAAVTLAAWNDSETASGQFGASVFATESKGSGDAGFIDHGTTPATLSFSGGAMSPGTLRYAWLDVRTTAATNVGGSAVLSAVATTADTGLASALRYKVVAIAATTSCDAAAIGSATLLTMTQVPSAPALSAALAAAGGSTVRFCFEVQLPAGSPSTLQGTSATFKWTVTSTSSS
jgi:predicted ribosomally synthesized peptide with SipW-like signal peptide